MSEKIDKQATLAGLSLGKATEYIEIYTPTLLQAVPRSMNRVELNLTAELPFYGTDRWNGYELSWLNSKGKPQVAIMRCEVPASSPNLVESKSFKLYLNSFNQSHFDSIESVTEALNNRLVSMRRREGQSKTIQTSRVFSNANCSIRWGINRRVRY